MAKKSGSSRSFFMFIVAFWEKTSTIAQFRQNITQFVKKTLFKINRKFFMMKRRDISNKGGRVCESKRIDCPAKV